MTTAIQFDPSRDWLRAEVNGVEMYTRQDDGWCGMSVRGLARACGIDESSVRQALGMRKGVKTPKWAATLEPQCIRISGYGNENHIVAVKYTTCVRFLTHFAAKKQAAMDTLAGFAAIGLQAFIHQATNYQLQNAFRDPVVIGGLYYQALQENETLRISERQAREATEAMCDIAKDAIAENERLSGRALADHDLQHRSLLGPGLRTMLTACVEAELPFGDVTAYELLREEGYLSRSKDHWNLPTRKGFKTGAFKVVTREVEIGGRPQSKSTALVTDKGVTWLKNRYADRTDRKTIDVPRRRRLEGISQRAGLSLEDKNPDGE